MSIRDGWPPDLAGLSYPVGSGGSLCLPTLFEAPWWQRKEKQVKKNKRLLALLLTLALALGLVPGPGSVAYADGT